MTKRPHNQEEGERKRREEKERGGRRGVENGKGKSSRK
jgi:hypothetical protein